MREKNNGNILVYTRIDIPLIACQEAAALKKGGEKGLSPMMCMREHVLDEGRVSEAWETDWKITYAEFLPKLAGCSGFRTILNENLICILSSSGKMIRFATCVSFALISVFFGDAYR